MNGGRAGDDVQDLDDDLVAALRHLEALDRHRRRPLCPGCGRREQDRTSGLCVDCGADELLAPLQPLTRRRCGPRPPRRRGPR